MKARIFCPKHGRLSLDEVMIKNGMPICKKCSAGLQFGNIRPRKIKPKRIKPKKLRGKKVKRK